VSKAGMSRAELTEQIRAQKKARALIHLAFLGGKVARAGDLKPELEIGLRKELIEQEMLAVGPKTKKGLPLTLLDAGWRWVMDNINPTMPPQLAARENISMAILSRLGTFLKVNGLTVQDVIQANRINQEPTKAASPGASPEEALLKIALDLAGGHIGERVRLRDLRPKMENLGYTRIAVDRAISRLQLESTLSVIPIDLPTDIDDRDRAATIDIAGVPRHAIIVRRRPQ
jgi:hypothetical protein